MLLADTGRPSLSTPDLLEVPFESPGRWARQVTPAIPRAITLTPRVTHEIGRQSSAGSAIRTVAGEVTRRFSRQRVTTHDPASKNAPMPPNAKSVDQNGDAYYRMPKAQRQAPQRIIRQSWLWGLNPHHLGRQLVAVKGQLGRHEPDGTPDDSVSNRSCRRLRAHIMAQHVGRKPVT